MLPWLRHRGELSAAHGSALSSKHFNRRALQCGAASVRNWIISNFKPRNYFDTSTPSRSYWCCVCTNLVITLLFHMCKLLLKSQAHRGGSAASQRSNRTAAICLKRTYPPGMNGIVMPRTAHSPAFFYPGHPACPSFRHWTTPLGISMLHSRRLSTLVAKLTWASATQGQRFVTSAWETHGGRPSISAESWSILDMGGSRRVLFFLTTVSGFHVISRPAWCRMKPQFVLSFVSRRAPPKTTFISICKVNYNCVDSKE